MGIEPSWSLIVVLGMLASLACGGAEPTPTLTPVPAAIPTPTATPVPPPTFTPLPTVPPSPTPTVESSLAQTLANITRNIVLQRRLPPLTEIDRNFMTRTELEAFLREKFEEEREDVLKAQELLTILNLIPKDLDLFHLYLDLLSEQVLGLYDSKTEELYVIGEVERFGPLEEVTLAHELVHALQQQHFDIHSLHEAVEENSDSQAALSALIEGDAYLATFEYMDIFLTPQQRQEVLQSARDSPVLEQAPYAIQKSFFFEIEDGIRFVFALRPTGGLDAVDRAFTHPPVSTEQILHPEKYLQKEAPVSVSLPDLAAGLGAGWSERDSDVLGEFGLRTYLETGVAEPVAAVAAAGWGGDRYALLHGAQGERTLVLLSVWDTDEDAKEFFAVALTPLEGVTGERYAGIQGGRVLFIVAPTESLVEAVRAQFPGF